MLTNAGGVVLPRDALHPGAGQGFGGQGRRRGAYRAVARMCCVKEGGSSPRHRTCVVLPTEAGAGGSYTAMYGSTRSFACSLRGVRAGNGLEEGTGNGPLRP